MSLEPQNPPPSVLMEELAEEDADLTDPKWHSAVGAEVLEEYMQQKMTLSRILGSDGADCEDYDTDDSERSLGSGEDDVHDVLHRYWTANAVVDEQVNGE